MVLAAEQKRFFEEYGYLKYDRKVLTDEELEAVRQRSEDIARGTANHVPPRFIQLEEKFREADDDPEANDDPMDRLDQVRKMTKLSYFDELFAATVRKPEIVDVIEELLGPNIKLYTEQLMMKPRFHGTVTDWHQDSPSFPFFLPQKAVSCWVAMDDATVENGCMTVIPGSHKWGPVAKEYKHKFLDEHLVREPVPVEVKAGYCMFHDGLNMHRTGANNTPHRRRGLAIHYIKSETMYLPPDDKDEEARLYREAERPKGTFRFMLVRGKEFDGRV